MRLSLQKKLFLSFFATAALLVLTIAGGIHYQMRNGFDDYIAQVKLRRLAIVESEVVRYVAQHGQIDGLKDPATWMELVLQVEDTQREKRMERSGNEYIGAAERYPHLPRYVRGVALLDAQGVFVVGDKFSSDLSVTKEIKGADKQLIGFWSVRKDPSDEDDLGHAFLARQLNVVMVLMFVAAVLSLIVAGLLAEHFKKPMVRLQSAFRRVAQGHLDTRLSEDQTDETAEIARNFNAMTAQLQAQANARQQWVSDTSHELRTPLTILRMRNEAMRDGIIPAAADEWQHNLNTITDLTNLVDDLQAVSRAVEGGWDLRKTKLFLPDWLQDVVQEHLPAFAQQGLALRLQDDVPAVTVCADDQRLTQVLRNVLVNSLRYTDAPGSVVIGLQADGKRVHIVVSDSAPAVSDEALKHLFERFYRCDTSRNRAKGGSGLGLAICEGIIKAHGGLIYAQHSELGGLTVVIELPLNK